MASKLDKIKNSIINVGDGRGFVVNAGGAQWVITCAHCLPFFPKCHVMNFAEEKTYRNLLGRIGTADRETWAECIFVDPISDTAVLSGPDSEAFSEEMDKYETLTADICAIRIAAAKQDEPICILGVNGEWRQSAVESVSDRFLGISMTDLNLIEPGMSGSPILTKSGQAVGIVALDGDLNPNVARLLPVWIWKVMCQPQPKRRTPS